MSALAPPAPAVDSRLMAPSHTSWSVLDMAVSSQSSSFVVNVRPASGWRWSVSSMAARARTRSCGPVLWRPSRNGNDGSGDIGWGAPGWSGVSTGVPVWLSTITATATTATTTPEIVGRVIIAA
ncbi:MAG: hypothetical protein HY815_33155 [Candidatus Riflebacteria bacterium]|nr:hypothetical protein [Candidatus Riflebacteria bacterium]